MSQFLRDFLPTFASSTRRLKTGQDGKGLLGNSSAVPRRPPKFMGEIRIEYLSWTKRRFA